MRIEDMTIGEFQKIKKLLTNKSDGHPYAIGKAYLIRTVTFYYIGVLREVFSQEIVLSDCSWIADTGRYSDAIASGSEILNEIEPVIGSVIIGRGSIIDCVQWTHKTTLGQK